MDSEDLPLLLAADAFMDEAADSYPLDPVRMQKGVFLLVKRGPVDWRDLFVFRPYHWGPYSYDLRRSVDTLLDRGFLFEDRRPWQRFGSYRTTDLGDQVAEALLEDLSDDEIRLIKAVRRYVIRRNFPRLLREIYDRYPEYATRSIFSG